MQFIIFLSFVLGGSFIFNLIQAATLNLNETKLENGTLRGNVLVSNRTTVMGRNETVTSPAPITLAASENRPVLESPNPLLKKFTVSNTKLNVTKAISPSPKMEMNGTISSSENETEATTERELLYLEMEYDYLSREEFWKDNKFECINGTMVPSRYLRRKYRECEIIHRSNPKCTRNCQQAITMLLGEKRTPELNLYQTYFELALPKETQGIAVKQITNCFKNFGRNEDDFLDYKCEKPQKFLECAKQLDNSIPCKP